MRLVDADDAVNRFEELKPKGSSLDVRYAYGVSVGLEMAKHVTMSELFTVDAVPVVRCRDCKYWDTFPASSAAPAYRECKARARRLGRVHTTADEFCSRGERKDGEHETD